MAGRINLVCTFLLIISYNSVVYTENLNNGDNCKIEHSEIPGICTPISECPSLIREYSSGGSVSKCGYDKRILLACCPVESSVTPVTPSRSKRISETKCSEYATAVFYRSNASHIIVNLSSRKENTLLNGCGNVAIQLIVGGIRANPKEFPHMALIGVTSGTNQQPDWICGGSLISDQFVLVAAHCLVRNPNIIRLGVINYAKDNDDAALEDYNIIKQIIHPNYNYSTKYDDIALLKLDRRVEFNIYKRPACLPSSLRITQEVAIATSWEHESSHGNLQKNILNVYNQSECINIYSKQGIAPITDNQFCAGSKSDDTCQSDSGGPIQVIHENEYCMYRILGITSFGVTCASNNVYTRVYSYIDWIEENVWGTSSSVFIDED